MKIQTAQVAALCAGLFWGLAGCATNSPLALAPVGPQRPGGSGTQGQLMVWTETERVNSGGIFYDVHTPYTVYDQAGKQVASVQNHVGPTDQAPRILVFPTGQFTVVGRAEAFGLVRVPVVIHGGKLTEVNLERGGIPKAHLDSNTNLVRFPNGDVVGWRAPDR